MELKTPGRKVVEARVTKAETARAGGALEAARIIGRLRGTMDRPGAAAPWALYRKRFDLTERTRCAAKAVRIEVELRQPRPWRFRDLNRGTWPGSGLRRWMRPSVISPRGDRHECRRPSICCSTNIVEGLRAEAMSSSFTFTKLHDLNPSKNS